MAANNFIVGGSGNWNSTASWSLGAVPVHGDGNVATFTASSPACTITSLLTASCDGIDFTNYTNTITFTASYISVYGNITLGSAMTFAGSSSLLQFASSGTLTSNGKSIISGVYFGITATATITLVGNATVAYLNAGNNLTYTINKTSTETFTITTGFINTFNCIINGTATIIFNSISVLTNPSLTINNSVTIAGNLSASTSFLYFGGTVTYSSGTGVVLGTVGFLAGSSINGFTNALIFQNLYFQGNGTVTLNSNIYCVNLVIGTTTNTLILNSNTIYVTNLNSTLTSGTCTGSTTIVLNGCGVTLSSTGISNTITTNVPTKNTFQYGGVNYNWNTAGNWSKGTVPTVSDGYVTTFAVGSPNCTVNVTAFCNSIDFTNYTNTITMTYQINIGSSITLGSSMVISGVQGLVCLGSGTIKSNGKTWTNPFIINIGNGTIVLSGNLTVNGLVSFNTGSSQPSITVTVNKTTTETLTCAGGLNAYNVISGTVAIIITGGAWGSGNYCNVNNNISINGNCTITAFLGTGTFTYISGTVTTGTLFINSSTTWNAGGWTWGTITLWGAVGTITMQSDINCNTMTWANGSPAPTFTGGYNINCITMGILTAAYFGTTNVNCSGTFSVLGNIGGFTGSGTFNCGGFNLSAGRLIGTLPVNVTGGVVQSANSVYYISDTIIFAGNITVSGTIYTYLATITYLSGVITTTNSTLNVLGTTTFNTNGMTWNNITFASVTSPTYTLSSDLNCTGTLTSQTNGTTTFSGAHNINCGALLVGTTCIYNLSGNIVSSGLFTVSVGATMTSNNYAISCAGLTTNGSLNGTTSISMLSGTWQGTLGTVKSNLTLASGCILSGTVNYNTGTLTGSGTLTSTNSTIVIALSTTLDLGGMILNNITLPTGLETITLNSNIGIAGALTSTGSTATTHNIFKSNVGGTKRIMTLLGTCDLSFVDATDIDSSQGVTIFTYGGTLNNTKNWSLLVPPVSTGRISML